MKIIILLASICLYYVVVPPQISAGGTCHCTVGQNRATYVNENNCTLDSTPTCAGPQSALTCSCKLVNTATDCGDLAQACCTGNVCKDDLVCINADRAGLICTSPNNNLTDRVLPPDSSIAPSTSTPPFDLCGIVGDNSGECRACFADGGESGGVWTGLGCIRWNPKLFIIDFLRITLGVGGGIAFLLMIYGSFLISVSTGDPKKAEEGKEIITGAIAGLLFIIFSAFLLKLIGVDILNIPGF